MAIAKKVFIIGIFLAVSLKLLRPYLDGGVCTSSARLDGKVIIVTGSNAGIGKETVKDFVTRGGKVYMACRSVDRANAAAQDILKETGAPKDRLVVMKLDLSSLQSVRQFTREFKSRESRLDILVNNAGIFGLPERTLTEDGFEMQFATNHLGHFLLTNLLLDLLVTSAPSRVVTVSGKLYELYGDIEWEDIQLERNYGPIKAYAQSKLANIIFSRELGKRLKGTGVTTYALHPGVITTNLAQHSAISMNPVVRYLYSLFGKSPKQGAQTTICCAVDEKLAGDTGKYYSDVEEAQPTQHVLDDQGCKRLWDMSVDMVKLTKEEISMVLV